MSVATLGQYELDCWNAPESPFTLPKEHLETETRAGLDGFIVWLVGKFGDPFEVDTVTFKDTYANAVSVKYLYEQLKGDVALTLAFDAEVPEFRFKVLEVKPKCTRIVHGHIAGDNTVYGARIDTKWTLAAIPYSNQ